MDKPNPNTAFNTAINHDGEEESTRHIHLIRQGSMFNSKFSGPLKEPDIKSAKKILRDKHPLENIRLDKVFPILGRINCFSGSSTSKEEQLEKEKEHHALKHHDD